MRKIKWENIIFILMVGAYIYNAFSIDKNVMSTLLIQISMSYVCREIIKYIRKNGIKKALIIEED